MIEDLPLLLGDQALLSCMMDYYAPSLAHEEQARLVLSELAVHGLPQSLLLKLVFGLSFAGFGCRFCNFVAGRRGVRFGDLWFLGQSCEGWNFVEKANLLHLLVSHPALSGS